MTNTIAREDILTNLAGIACETNTGIQTLPLSSEPSFAYWQQDIPREYCGAWRQGAGRARRGSASQARLEADRARPPLPARGHHPVRRLPWRLVQARAVGRRATPRPSTSSSAASTSWPKPPTSSARLTRRSSCPTWPPAARWPTWPTPKTSTPAGTSSKTPASPTASCPSPT